MKVKSRREVIEEQLVLWAFVAGAVGGIWLDRKGAFDWISARPTPVEAAAPQAKLADFQFYSNGVRFKVECDDVPGKPAECRLNGRQLGAADQSP